MQTPSTTPNLIPNADFGLGPLGGLPDQWQLKSWPELEPVFKLVRRDGRQGLMAAGNGDEDCCGWVFAPVEIQLGRTYRLTARFRISPGLDPMKNLLFSVYTDGASPLNNGIFHFRRDPQGGGRVIGEERFLLPGRGVVKGQVRVCFRLSARGKVWFEELSFEACEPVPPRWVKVACAQGAADLKQWGRVLDGAGRAGADLVLLPEFMGGQTAEPENGPSARLLAQKAREYSMYAAAGILIRDKAAQRQYNCAYLFDRQGKLAGRYIKNHLYSPELLEMGTTPGTEVPVFQTDFGKVGMMICYDSWFPDVTELLALKGAEIVLFPNAGYYRGLMPARAADNRVRIVTSSLEGPCGIWDTAGGDVEHPGLDETRHPGSATTFKGVRARQIGTNRVLIASLDLSQSPSPHNWGGPMLSAPGGRRNRREQKRLLHDEIRREIERWWD